MLLRSVRAFARDAPQEDDMTAVLIKRELPPAIARFARRIDAVGAVFDFVGGEFARHGIDPSLRRPVELALEELFTNMVKYGRGGGAEVQLSLSPIPGGVEAILVDEGVEPFDPTAAPEVDVLRPLSERQPGGLGIHLVKQLVDSIGYEYRADRRESRITFRKTVPGSSPSGAGAAPGGRDGLD